MASTKEICDLPGVLGNQPFYVISETLRALDVLSNGRLCIWEQHSGDNQQFQFEPVDQSLFLIKCVCRPGCVVNVEHAGLDDGQPVTCHPQRGGPNQLFALQRLGDTQFYHIVAQHSGKALAIDSRDPTTAYVVQRTIDPDDVSQRFILVPRGAIQWYWAGGDRPGNSTGFNCVWQEYASDVAARLEAAYGGHQQRIVDLGPSHVVDMTDSSRMTQVRKDDPGAWRRVARVVRVAPVKWYVWNRDGGWRAYDEAETARLEIAYNAQLKRVEVRAAFIDMANKTSMLEIVPYDQSACDRVVVRRLCLGPHPEPTEPPVLNLSGHRGMVRNESSGEFERTLLFQLWLWLGFVEKSFLF
eukprot:TRINITY_DN9230_c0_g1_i1.p1 TRINITY_DN9230_c0_g1~~TRINITY_DN9230_c0_g1_i1.p1  ORF type:complete len:356 (-),score=63.40 TRINITY_DN9230_c0_g1_i1:99-1166(-)